MNIKTTCCIGLLLCLAAQASATIITPVSATPSSEFAPAINLINGSGLDPLGLHDNNENNMWQTCPDILCGNGVMSAVGETVEFELESNYDLSEAIIWQYNGLNGFGLPELDRELDEIELEVSSSLAGAYTSIGTFNLAPAFDQTSSAGEAAQLFALSDPAADNVRRVRLTILSVQGGVDDGTAGLSEVRFNGIKIPEPASAMTCLLGVAMLGLFRKRKRRR